LRLLQRRPGPIGIARDVADPALLAEELGVLIGIGIDLGFAGLDERPGLVEFSLLGNEECEGGAESTCHERPDLLADGDGLAVDRFSLVQSLNLGERIAEVSEAEALTALGAAFSMNGEGLADVLYGALISRRAKELIEWAERVIGREEVDVPRALPVELRERVVKAYNDGEGTYAELAERFGVGEASVSRWLRRDRDGRLAARPQSRWSPEKRKLMAEHLEWLEETIEDIPDSTAPELVAALVEVFGVVVSEATVKRARTSLGFTRKKGTPSRRSAIAKTS
jgi:transposase